MLEYARLQRREWCKAGAYSSIVKAGRRLEVKSKVPIEERYVIHEVATRDAWAILLQAKTNESVFQTVRGSSSGSLELVGKERRNDLSPFIRFVLRQPCSEILRP